MLTLNDGRAELWQWDTGRTLSVDADCSQVHFSNKVFGRSIDVDVVDGSAIIPDILLQTDNDLNVWAFAGTAENGYTKISKTFNVNRRNKPADYVFTPTDQMTLKSIQSQIGDLADLTTEAKENLVAAINEAAASGGGSSDAVLYTTQTLTDAQKKQARENVDAASNDFVITGSLTEVGGIALDKTFAQIQEAVQAGKTVLMRIDGGPTTITLPLAVKNSDISTEYDFSIGYFIEGRLNGVTVRVMESGPVLYTASTHTNNPDGTMPQVNMAASPTEAMQIATKKYVDDHAAGGTDMGITGAAVGQIAKITAVDASGVPTEWAPVDMPSGMSEWQLITDTTIAEEDASTTLFVSQKDSGESFLCHELLIAWIGIAVTDGTESGKAWISLNPGKAGYNSGKCGTMTSAFFYYTTQANYMRTMHVESLPYKVEYVDTGVSTSDTIDAQVIWQNGISSVEVSAYGRKSFYGRVIIYGR